MHRISEYYREPGIFKNALNGFLINIVGVIVLIVILAAALIIASVTAATVSTPSIIGPGFFLGILGATVAVFVLTIISTTFYKRAFEKLGEKSGVQDFNSAGSLFLTGTILTIIPLVGGLIVWLAWIDAASGFSSLKSKTSEHSTMSYSAPQPQVAFSFAKKFCPYCGAQITADSIYCQSCGKKLP